MNRKLIGSIVLVGGVTAALSYFWNKTGGLEAAAPIAWLDAAWALPQMVFFSCWSNHAFHRRRGLATPSQKRGILLRSGMVTAALVAAPICMALLSFKEGFGWRNVLMMLAVQVCMIFISRPSKTEKAAKANGGKIPLHLWWSWPYAAAAFSIESAVCFWFASTGLGPIRLVLAVVLGAVFGIGGLFSVVKCVQEGRAFRSR